MACLRRDTLLALRGVRLELERELNLPLDALKSQKDRIKVLIEEYFNKVDSRQYVNTEEPELGEEECVAEETVQESESKRVANEKEKEKDVARVEGRKVMLERLRADTAAAEKAEAEKAEAEKAEAEKAEAEKAEAEAAKDRIHKRKRRVRGALTLP